MEQVAPKVGLCKDCNYSLRDLPSNRCPECGREFDPADPGTMNMGRAMGPVARWILGPIGWPALLVVLLPMVWLWWLYRVPGIHYDLFPILLMVVPIVVVLGLCAVYVGAREITAKRVLQPEPFFDALSQRRILWAFVLFLILAVGAPLRVPLLLGFYLSKPAMDRFVHRYLNERGSLPPGGEYRVGLYGFNLTRVERDGDLCVFRSVSRAEGGFVYAPQGFRAYRMAVNMYGSLGGNWYWFSEE